LVLEAGRRRHRLRVPLVAAKAGRQGRRLTDALIIPDGGHREAHWRDIDIDGQDVIVVQTKAARLCMYLLDQAVFSPRLLAANWTPRSIRSLALCLADDEALPDLDHRAD